ncbi:hypothetical protein D3C78_807880 [compost metagenome]
MLIFNQTLYLRNKGNQLKLGYNSANIDGGFSAFIQYPVNDLRTCLKARLVIEGVHRLHSFGYNTRVTVKQLLPQEEQGMMLHMLHSTYLPDTLGAHLIIRVLKEGGDLDQSLKISSLQIHRSNCSDPDSRVRIIYQLKELRQILRASQPAENLQRNFSGRVQRMLQHAPDLANCGFISAKLIKLLCQILLPGRLHTADKLTHIKFSSEPCKHKQQDRHSQTCARKHRP